MEICIKWNMCRVCLLEEQKSTKGDSGQLCHLFNEDKKLVDHIYEFFGVCMKPNDSLPDKICLKCVSIVNNAVQLRKTCRSSHNYLQSVVERAKSASTLFKPDVSKCQMTYDEIEVEDPKIDSVKIEYENSSLEKRKGNVAEQDGISDENSQIIKNIENIERQEVEVHQAHNNSGSLVELEELIEVSDEIEDQILTQTIEEDTDEATNTNIKHIKNETSPLQKYYMNARFSTLKTIEDDGSNSKKNHCVILENGETDTSEATENHEESYHIFKESKSINSNDNESLDQHEELHSESDKDFEFISVERHETVEGEIEESLMINVEEKITDNENQAQVSSTVDTNDEIEFYEHNSDSNLASDFDEECLVVENFSSSNISSSKPSPEETTSNFHTKVYKIESKALHIATEKGNSTAGFSRRRAKRILNKPLTCAEYKLSVCEICGNQYTNRNLMKIHMKVHLKEKNHQCELCSKRFITACNLQAHMRIHTGERPFECKYCDRRFNDRSSNLRHERTHTNEKPFECANCGKSFSLATTLQNHMKVHTNERSYRCEPCGKSFKLPHHLKTHQNTSLHRSMAQMVKRNEI